MGQVVRFPPLSTERQADSSAERMRLAFERAINELLGVRLVRGRLIEDVELPDATEVPLRHGFGRKALAFLTPPVGASTSGRIEVKPGSSADTRTTEYVVLEANGYGATVTVSVWLF